MPPPHLVKWKPAARPLLALLALLIAAGPLSAQDILGSAPPEPLVPPILRNKEQPPPLSRPPAPPDTPFKIGPIVLHPALSYGYMHADGLPAANGDRIASEIHTISANVSADLGERWTLSYSPSWMYHSAGEMEDTFDQSANLGGLLVFGDWGIRISESYSQSTPTLIETGRQTKQETWATSLGTSYSFNDTVHLQISGGLNERYTDLAPDLRSWNSSVGFNLIFSPRLSVNLGTSFGYNELKDAPDLYNESFNAQFSWQPVEKLTLGMSAGMQYSHSNASAAVTLSDPLMNFTLGYQPFETTSVNFSAAQTVTPSYFENQVSKSLRWSVGVNQRLLGRFYLNASYAPYDTEYMATDSVTASGRKDSVKSYSAGLSTQLFGRLSISLSFTQTENSSSQEALSFSTKQYGIQCRYSY